MPVPVVRVRPHPPNYAAAEFPVVLDVYKRQATSIVSETEVTASYYEDASGKSEYAQNMYINGDKLVILVSVDEWWEPASDKDPGYKSYTNAVIYDISNPASPSLITQLGQDGYLSDSRLLNGILYLVSNYSIYELNEENVDTYIPSTYSQGESACMPVDDLCVPINTTERCV